jgi:Family of unknown function (DUF6335)
MKRRKVAPLRSRAKRRVAKGRRGARPGEALRHGSSGTAVAAEALRTGLLPATARRRLSIPHEDETIRIGDPDDDSLANEYVGEDVPGGSTPTPDQSNVDEIGRAYGLQDEDNGTLRTSAEVLGRRDRHRPELRAPTRPR